MTRASMFSDTRHAVDFAATLLCTLRIGGEPPGGTSLCSADTAMHCVPLSGHRFRICCDHLVDISQCRDLAMLKQDAAIAPFAQ
jgi:hypothetical protein